MWCERGQATIEWTAVVLLVSVAFGALVAVGPRVDGRSFGAFLAHSIACAARGGCQGRDDELAAAYGARDAALVREYAPNLVYEPGVRALPVDYRHCRSRACSDAAGDRGLDVHRAEGGAPATAFTRLVRRDGETFIQYWLYYLDSNTTWAASDRLWAASPAARAITWAATGRAAYPGYHRDDWESYQVRVDAGGRAWVRASSHGRYQWCKERRCRDRWGPWTGWTRVSRGSHAGHIPVRLERSPPFGWRRPPGRGAVRFRPSYPGVDLHERTTTGEALRLVPTEGLDRRSYRPLDRRIRPPWGKEVYDSPRAPGS